MIKHQIFVYKHSPVQAQRNEHQQKILDLFKLVTNNHCLNVMVHRLLCFRQIHYFPTFRVLYYTHFQGTALL